MNKLVAALAAAIIGCLLAPADTAAADAPPMAALHESFAEVADGPAPTAGGVTDYAGMTEAALPYVRGGFLTTADPDKAVGGSYRIADFAADVTTVGAEFAFSPYSTVGGVLCLSIQDASIADTAPLVPASPVHFIITPTGWALDVNREASTGVERVASGEFDQPLTADGRTLHTVELTLDRAAGKLRIVLPGPDQILAHEAFRMAGDHVYVEPFKSPLGGPLAEQTNALVSEWWASTEAVTVSETAEVVPAPQVNDVPPVVIPEVLPTVEAPVVRAPVAPVIASAPDAPRKVRAERTGRRVEISWRHARPAESYDVRCGTQTVTVSGVESTMRTKAGRCSVRAVSAAGASTWVRTRVR